MQKMVLQVIFANMTWNTKMNKLKEDRGIEFSVGIPRRNIRVSIDVIK